MEVLIDVALEYYGKRLNHKKIEKLHLEENKSTASTMLDSTGNFSVSEVRTVSNF